MAKVSTPILGTHRIKVESVRVRVEVESTTLMVPPFEVDVPPEHRGEDSERAFVLAELRRRCPGLRLEVVPCDACDRTDPHVHCLECGSTEHLPANCDMEG